MEFSKARCTWFTASCTKLTCLSTVTKSVTMLYILTNSSYKLGWQHGAIRWVTSKLKLPVALPTSPTFMMSTELPPLLPIPRWRLRSSTPEEGKPYHSSNDHGNARNAAVEVSQHCHWVLQGSPYRLCPRQFALLIWKVDQSLKIQITSNFL